MSQPETNLHGTIDARVWAKEFMRTMREHGPIIEESFMSTWFANAIMAGYDNQHGRVQKLKQLVLLVDPAVSNVTMNELSTRQWNEYIRTYPDEG